MAQDRKQKTATGTERGNEGTGDQGAGDVGPHGKVGASTGRVASAKSGDGKGKQGAKSGRS
jgi:hypothetical protein